MALQDDPALDELDERSQTLPGIDMGLENRTAALEKDLDKLQHKSSPGPASADPIAPTQTIQPIDSNADVTLAPPGSAELEAATKASLMKTPLPTRPNGSWADIENHEYYKALTPEQKVFKLNSFARKSRDYLQSLEGSDAAQVEKHIHGFLSAKLKGIYPDPAAPAVPAGSLPNYAALKAGKLESTPESTLLQETVGESVEGLKKFIDEAAPGFREQATTSPLPATHLAPDANDSILASLGKAGLNTATGLVEGLTSPAMAALLPLGGASPALGKVVAGGFAADMAHQIPSQIEQAITAPTFQEKAEGALGAVSSVLLAKSAGAHALTPTPHAIATRAAVEQFHTASAKAAEFDAKGFPESAKATREAAHAELHENISNFDSKVASTSENISPPATDVNPAVEPQSPPATETVPAKAQTEAGASEASRVQGPALVGKDGAVLEQGKNGDTHAVLLERAMKGPNAEAALEAFTNDAQHGFVDDQGNVLTREQAADLGVKSKQLPEGTKRAQSQQFQPIEEPSLKSPISAVENVSPAVSDEVNPLSADSDTALGTSGAAWQKATHEGVSEALRAKGVDPDAIGWTPDAATKIAATISKAHSVFPENPASYAERARDRIQSDLLENVEKTGNPLKVLKADGTEANYSPALVASREISNAHEKIGLREQSIESRKDEDGHSLEDITPAEGLTPSEQAQQNEHASPIEGEHPYSAAVRGAIAKHFKSFTKSDRGPFESAPNASREQMDRAARVVYDQILKEATGHSLGIGDSVDLRGKPGPVNKLVADPSFREAVNAQIADRIRQDIRSTVPKDRALGAKTAEARSPLEHASDLVDRGVPLATVLDSLPDAIKGRVQDVRDTYATDKGINAVMERIGKTITATEDGRLQKALAQALSKVGDNAKVIVDPTLEARGYLGEFQQRSGDVKLATPASENAFRATAIHEKVHSVLSSKTEAFTRGDLHLLDKMDLAAFQDLEAMRQQALEHESVPAEIKSIAKEKDLTKRQTRFQSESTNRAFYGLTDLHEFLAEAVTNQGLQKFLNGITAKGVAATQAKTATVWAKVKVLMRMLVLGRPVAEDSILARAFDKTIDLLKSGTLEDQSALKAVNDLKAPAPFDAVKYEARREKAFTDDFAAHHGFKDSESMVASDPHLFNEASELYKGTHSGRIEQPSLKSLATDLETQDETTKRAKTLFGKIDAVPGFGGKAETIIREALEQGGSTKEDFARAFETGGLNPELAEAAGRMIESHFKVAASEEAVRPSPNFAGPGAASFEEHVHNRIVDGTDIYRGLSEANGKPPTRETWQRNFLREYPELADDPAALTEAWEGAQRVAAHADKTGAPVSDAEKQVRTGDVPAKDSPTSIKNEIVDKERRARGLPAVADAAKKTFGQTWEEASRKIDADPQALNELVESLEKKSRPVTDVEDAMLLHRQIDLQNELDKAYAKLDSGTAADKVEARVRAAALQDQYNSLGQITKQVGTELGRGLNARKMMASEDYSLAKLMQRRKAANNGDPLTPEQETEVKDQHTKIAAAKETLSDYEKKRATALKAYKTRLKNATTDYEKRTIEEDFVKRERNPLQLDTEALKLKAAFEDAKLTYERANVRDQLAHRSPADKIRDTFLKYRRAFVLSGPTTLGKLTSAAIERMTFTPIEEAVGSVYTKLFPKLSEKAAREGGGFNVTAEAKALAEGFTTGMSDSWQTLTTGKSDLDLAFGKGDIMPRDLTDYLGSLHGALKASTKRNEFARSLEKRFDHAIKNGVDVTDPLVQMRLGTEAYKDANRSIFMNDNRVVSAYKRALSALEQPSKETGTTAAWSKNTALVLRTLLPIVKVPSNVVAETFQYALGSVTGGVKLAKAYHAGIETLKPEEASLIMRELKKGSLGAGIMLLGFLNPQTIGGYYQPGEKRKTEDVKAASVRVFGHDVPSFLIHNPLLETLQIGATIRRVADSKLRRRDRETQGVGAGVLAAALGLTDEIPFVQEMLHIADAFQPNGRDEFFGELTKSIVIPQGVQSVASMTDKDAAGNTRRRKPRTLLEHLKAGVPGMRQSVPLKPKKG